MCSLRCVLKPPADATLHLDVKYADNTHLISSSSAFLDDFEHIAPNCLGSGRVLPTRRKQNADRALHPPNSQSITISHTMASPRSESHRVRRYRCRYIGRTLPCSADVNAQGTMATAGEESSHVMRTVIIRRN